MDRDGDPEHGEPAGNPEKMFIKEMGKVATTENSHKVFYDLGPRRRFVLRPFILHMRNESFDYVQRGRTLSITVNYNMTETVQTSIV